MKTAVAVIESGVEEQNALAAQNAGGIVRTIAQQIEAVRQAELICLFQRLRLGALVKNSVALLGLEGRGKGHKGDGAKGWWESTFRDADGSLPVSYDKIMRWGRAAEKIPQILRDKGYACAKNLTAEKIIAILAKNPEQVISNDDREVLDVADKETNGMTLRQMLLWGDDAEPKRPGRPKGSGKSGDGEYKQKSTLECAVETVWPTVEYMLKHRGAMFTSYKLLPDEKLSEMRDTLHEHVQAIEAVLAQRAKSAPAGR